MPQGQFPSQLYSLTFSTSFLFFFPLPPCQVVRMTLISGAMRSCPSHYDSHRTPTCTTARDTETHSFFQVQDQSLCSLHRGREGTQHTRNVTHRKHVKCELITLVKAKKDFAFIEPELHNLLDFLSENIHFPLR